MIRQKRVLFLSYPFPPVGGAGVQRTTKFVKYLPAHGWAASVLTVANPSVPARDESLLADVPEQTLVRRARTWEPGYGLKAAVSAAGQPAGGSGGVRGLAKGLARRLGNLVLQPDAQVLWLPHAIREGLRLLREVPHDALVATGPPFSTFLAAAALRRRSGLPLVLDYRDEWGISNAYQENRRPDPLSRWLQGRMQTGVVRAASALLATTRASARALEGVRDRARAEIPVSWIYNGFDVDDVPGDAPPDRPRDTYRLAYVGTLWNLTTVAPVVEAVRLLARRWPDLAPSLELVFAGRRTREQEALLDRLADTPCRVVRHPYVAHREVMDLVGAADGLLVLLADGPDAHRVVPAKVFESMASRRPVLAVAPPGELRDLLSDYPAALCRTPGDVEGIAAALAGEIRRVRAGLACPAGSWDGSRYDRRRQAGQLADLLDSLCATPRG